MILTIAITQWGQRNGSSWVSNILESFLRMTSTFLVKPCVTKAFKEYWVMTVDYQEIPVNKIHNILLGLSSTLQKYFYTHVSNYLWPNMCIWRNRQVKFGELWSIHQICQCLTSPKFRSIWYNIQLLTSYIQTSLLQNTATIQYTYHWIKIYILITYV